MRIAAWTPLLLVGLVACEDDPCGSYVDYMCECHPESQDCQDLHTIYDDAEADLQEECVLALDDQQAEDEASGLECGVGSDTGDTGV